MAPSKLIEDLKDYGAAPARKGSGRTLKASSGTRPSGGLPRVAVYLRVSTDQQADEGTSLNTQRVRCLELLDEEFGRGCYSFEVFQDPGQSGSYGPLANETHPPEPYRKDLHRLLEGVRQRAFSHVAALSVDRLYRDVVGLPLLKRLLDGVGSKLLFVLDQPAEGLAGELQGNVLASVGDFARKQSRQRSQMSIDLRKSEGYRLGTAPYGFRHEGEHEKVNRRKNIKPVPEELAVVRRIYDMSVAGLSCEKIADRLNAEGVPFNTGKCRPWNSPKVRNILVNPAYAGLVPNAAGMLIKALHWPHRVIEPEERPRVLEGLAHRRRRMKGVVGSQHFRLFAGVVLCGVCGHRLESNFCDDSPAYRCHRRGRKPGSGGHIFISAKSLEEAVVSEIAGIATTPEVLAAARLGIRHEVDAGFEPMRKRKDEARKAVQGLQARRSRLTDLFLDQSLAKEAYTEKLAEIGNAISELEREIAELTISIAGADDRERRNASALAALLDFPTLWIEAPDLEKRELLRGVVEALSVWLCEDRLLVRLKLYGLPEREVEAQRGRRPLEYDKPKGPQGLTPRQLAFLAHRKDGRRLREASSLMGVRESQGYRLRHQVYDWLGVKTDEEAIALCTEWIEENREALPLFGSKGSRDIGRHRLLKVIEFQLLCLVVEGGLTTEQIAAQHDMPVEVVEKRVASALVKAGRADPGEALSEVRRLGLAPGKKLWQFGTRRRLKG